MNIAIFVFYVLMQITTWLPLRFWKIWGGNNFLDSWQVLNALRLYNIDPKSLYSAAKGPFETYVYGKPLIYLLQLMQLNINWTPVLGYIFLGILSSTLAALYQSNANKNSLSLITFYLGIFSPPLLLLAERGNFDILIFGLLFAAVLSFRFNNRWLMYALIAISALFKFYTLPILAFISIFYFDRIKRLVAILVTGLVTISILRDYSQIPIHFPFGAKRQFGMQSFLMFINEFGNYKLSSSIQAVGSISIFIFALAVTYWFLKTSQVPRLSVRYSQGYTSFAYSVFTITFLSCFFITTNADYRLYLLLASNICLQRLYEELGANANWLLIFSILALWLSYPSGGLEPIGDIIITVFAALHCFNILGLCLPNLLNLQSRKQDSEVSGG
jgi:hypothetical protein